MTLKAFSAWKRVGQEVHFLVRTEFASLEEFVDGRQVAEVWIGQDAKDNELDDPSQTFDSVRRCVFVTFLYQLQQLLVTIGSGLVRNAQAQRPKHPTMKFFRKLLVMQLDLIGLDGQHQFGEVGK